MPKYSNCATCGAERGDFPFCLECEKKYAAAEESDVDSVPTTRAKKRAAHGRVKNKDSGDAIALRLKSATNAARARNDGPQAPGTQMDLPSLRQSDTNSGIYPGPLTYDFRGNIVAQGSNNNLQTGLSPVPAPNQSLGQLSLPQGSPNSLPMPNWPVQDYPTPMVIFNPVTGLFEASQGFCLPQFVPQQGGDGVNAFLPNPNQPFNTPDKGTSNNALIFPDDWNPTTPTTPNNNKTNNPHDGLPYHPNYNSIPRQTQLRLQPHQLQHPNPNPTYTTTLPNTSSTSASSSSKTTRRRPSTYGTGERGRRNARLHADGLCIWCQRPNPDLRRKGCPACLPRRAATTARWREIEKGVEG
ncbi:uncharacterized protein B0H64DRAFT_459506 [Chaetomium fimeti]|uniref:Uncharacterized protein n=1 Tax=Chaetomium fimeti TaxID=1854472 RepID=A0AAE0HF60_9PEZI|nr:hypothetical protein B0H64DRAFT_459506 [Chaetomium fimeti]